MTARTGAVGAVAGAAVTGPAGGSAVVAPAELLAGIDGVLVLDATVELPRPRDDGDHRAASGVAGWRAGRIPGSVHLDLLDRFADPGAGYHFAQPTTERAHVVLHALGLRDGRPVVVYDRADGFWAARTWWSLRALGVAARVLDGGLDAWRAAGGPVVGGPPGPDERVGDRPGPLTLRPRPEVWASLDDVREIVAGRRPGRLVCALGADQFDGSAPTRYSRRGHIPGSVSLPARAVSDDRGVLLPAEALRRAVAPVRGTAEPLVLYCGGGISASRLALALVVAGHEDLAIYDGSLEEWSARPELPLVTG